MNPEKKYVPVLRWKGAEIEAVTGLNDLTKNLIQPLFELVPKDFREDPIERSIALRVRRLLETWGWRHRCFIDFSLIEAEKAAAAISFFDRIAEESLKAVMCFGLQPLIDLRSVSKLSLVRKHGVCFRIGIFELRHASFSRLVVERSAELGLTPAAIDIIIDYGVIEALPDNLAAAVGIVESIATWRSITILAGAFPPDLSHLEKNNQYELTRYEWLAYRGYALAGGRAWYGDYTIQHPVFVEREGKGLNFSASIRYTAAVHWVIMRGEGVFNEEGPGFQQWPANAELLCAREEFCGPSFSPGDGYIKTMGSQSINTGGAKEWLTAGISHHIYYSVHQLTHITETPSAASVAGAKEPDWPAQVR